MTMLHRHVSSSVLILAAALLPGRLAGAHGMIPQHVPVERIIENLTAYIAEHPDDPTGYYRLGRTHMLALETKTEFVLAYERNDGFRPAAGSWVDRFERDEPAPVATPEQLRAHLTEAVTNLNRAIEMRPTEGRFRLTLACALEAGLPLIDGVDVWPLCPVESALEPGGAQQQAIVNRLLTRVEALDEDPTIADDLISRLRSYQWFGAREAIATLAYERRERAGFVDPVKRIRRADWEEQIEVQFFTAMCYALPTNGKASQKPIWGGLRDWVAYESAQEFIRVVEGRTSRNEDAIRLKVARETVAAFDGLPHPNAITPIILDFEDRGLAALTSSGTSSFDLDGSGRAQSWSWVTPDAGILVWDPECTGEITSGKQLFGSVTWWVFFDDGYQALGSLDDDRDGELTGGELVGLAVWFDRDGDGVSDTGEVVPIDKLGVVALSCRATAYDGAAPTNVTGMRMNDGRVLATYDWVARSVDRQGAAID